MPYWYGLVLVIADLVVLRVLLLAVKTDLKSREIKDSVSATISLLAILLIFLKLSLGLQVKEHFLGMVVVLPLILMGLRGKLGGGDYKLLLALGLYLGIYFGTAAIVLLLPIFVGLALYYLIKERSVKKDIAMAPLIATGSTLAVGLKWFIQFSSI